MATWLTGCAVTIAAHHGLLVPAGVSEAAAGVVAVGITAGVGVLSSVTTALWARTKVTPLDDPRDADGSILWRESELAPPDDPPDDEPAEEYQDGTEEHLLSTEEMAPPTRPISAADIARLRREHP